MKKALKFHQIKAKLKKLETLIEDFCSKQSIEINKERYYNESLSINLSKIVKNERFHVSLICGETSLKFSFIFLKSIDIKNVRYFKKQYLVKEEPIDFYTQQKLVDLILESLKLFEFWKINDLHDKVEVKTW